MQLLAKVSKSHGAAAALCIRRDGYRVLLEECGVASAGAVYRRAAGKPILSELQLTQALRLLKKSPHSVKGLAFTIKTYEL